MIVEVALLKCPIQALVGWLSEVMVIWLPTAPVMVVVPANVKSGVAPPASFTNNNVEPAAVSVKLLKVVEDVPLMVCETAVAKVIVPELWVKVPLFVKLPVILKLPEVEVKMAPLATVTLPVTLIVGLLVDAEAPALVPLPTSRLPATLMVCEPAVPKVSAVELGGSRDKLL